MITIPVAIAIAAISALLGGAVAWGALRQTVTQLQSTVTQLTSDVKALTTSVNELGKQVAVLQALDARESTGRHPAVVKP